MDALGIPSQTLLQLAEALEVGHVRGPLTKFGLRTYATSAEAVKALEELRQAVGGDVALARVCRLVVAERVATAARAPKVELVWTGPERMAASSRDTKIVFGELFLRAKRSVLVSSYSLGSGAKLFAPLAARMAEIPTLRVRMFFDLTVGVENMSGPRTREAYEARFVRHFQGSQWPGGRLPEVFHDPRTIEKHHISLHAKCVIIDEEVALVTSANTSSVAQEENIEAGVLIEDRVMVSALAKQFDDLVSAGELVPVPGLGPRRMQ